MKKFPTFVRLWKEHRVSLAIFIYCFNNAIYSTGFGNLILQKTCFPEGPPGTNVICNKTEAFKEYNTLSSVIFTLREMFSGILVLLAGSWRDQSGLSRPLILMGITGDIIGACMTLVASFIWNFSTSISGIVEILSGVPGSRPLVTAISLAYVTDRIPYEQRALKLVVFVVASTGGMCASFAVGGFLLSALNYSGFNVMVIGIHLLTVALSLHAYQDGERKNPGVRIKPIAILRGLKTIFLPRKNFFVTWVMLYSSFALFGLMRAEASVSNSFYQKVLSMNPEDAGLLQSYRLLTSVIMSFIVTPVFIGLLKLTEFQVSVISTIPIVVSCFCMAFVSTVLEAYIFYTLDMVRITLTSVLWTILSKSIRKCESGVYVSCVMFGEAITPMIITPLYVFIFNHTIDYFPGAFFIVSGFIVLSTTVLLIVSSYYYEKMDEEDDTIGGNGVNAATHKSAD